MFEQSAPSSISLKFTPYEAPPRHPYTPQPTGAGAPLPTTATTLSPGATTTSSAFQVQGPRRWGPQGYAGLATAAPRQGNTTPRQQQQRPAPAQQVPERRQPSEREMEAQALFGGLVRQQETDTKKDHLHASSIDIPSVQAAEAGTPCPIVSESTDLLDLDRDASSERRHDLVTGGTDDLIVRHDAKSSASEASTHDLDALQGAFSGFHVSDNTGGPSVMHHDDDPGSITLEPVSLDTASVGAQWPLLPVERRATIPVDPAFHSSAQVFFNRLQVRSCVFL